MMKRYFKYLQLSALVEQMVEQNPPNIPIRKTSTEEIMIKTVL